MSNIYMEMAAKEELLIETLPNKTISTIGFNKDNNIKIKFTDNIEITICYNCHGGVSVYEELPDSIQTTEVIKSYVD